MDPIFSAKKSSALEQGGVCFLFPISKGYFGQFKGYILCSGNVGGLFASEGGSCHRGFTIVLTENASWKGSQKVPFNGSQRGKGFAKGFLEWGL